MSEEQCSACVDEGVEEPRPVWAKGLCRRHYDRERIKRRDPEKHREASRRYAAKVAADPEKKAKAAARQRAWRRANGQRLSAELRERYATDPEFREQTKETSRRWREANREKVKGQQRAMNEVRRKRYAADPEYRERMKARASAWQKANTATKREMDRRWREANPDKVKANNSSPANLRRRRETYADLKLQVLLAYGDGSCALHVQNYGVEFRPDDIFELELDHINNDGAAHRKAITGQTNHRNYAQKFYLALRDAGWPVDPPLQTICAMCHKRKTLAHQRARHLLPT